MNRRKFVRTGAVGAAAAATTIAAPAIAQAPELKWRMASSFPKSLDTLYGSAEALCKRIHDLSDGKIQIRLFGPGEIVPGLQVLDAVQNGTIEMGHTASYYFVGKDPALGFDAAMPWGLTQRQQLAWFHQGGGQELIRALTAKYNIVSMPAGHTGAQMGGWFRKEIKTLEDVKGLKFRIAGMGGTVWAKLGAVPQQLAGGDIYPALERGVIDAAEWVGPYDDEKLGFAKVAPYYYYPGFWEGNATLSIYVAKNLWDQLPAAYHRIFEVAAKEASVDTMAKYDHLNPLALRKLVGGGAQLRPFPREVLQASWKATHEMYDELSAKSAEFKTIYESWRKYRDEEYLWFRAAELSFANFAFPASAAQR
jgi:TRAP-type mannitol/chloroaromatic compound transport system substrate-binding protein